MTAPYGLGGVVRQHDGSDGQGRDDGPIASNQLGPQHECNDGDDSQRADRVGLEGFPAVHSQQVRDASTDPEPAGRVERRQIHVRHVLQRSRIRQPGQVLGPELLIDRDAVQIQTRRGEGGKSERRGDEAGEPGPREEFCDPLGLAGAEHQNRNTDHCDAEHLQHRRDCLRDIGRGERRPLHSAESKEPDSGYNSGDQRSEGHFHHRRRGITPRDGGVERSVLGAVVVSGTGGA